MPGEYTFLMGVLLFLILVIDYSFKENRELRRRVGQLEVRCRTDTLTGLRNGIYFQEILSAEIARASRTTHPPSVIFLDLNGFKQTNDQLGHLVGNQLLVEVARRLRASVREYDTVTRWGGDEFAILLPGTEPSEAERVARRLEELIITSEEKGVTVTASLGLATFNGCETPEELIARADDLMMQAKAVGKKEQCVAV